jgi:diacylglycerol kinase family enzyme
MNNVEIFLEKLTEICSHSLVAPSRELDWVFITNPKAGGFSIVNRWKKHCKVLEKTVEKGKHNPLRRGGKANPAVRDMGKEGLLLTKSAESKDSGIVNLMEKLAADDKTFHLIITVGGDGTSLHVLNALYHSPPELKKNCVVLRLPMGTGNDGADAWEVDEALDLLTKPSETVFSRALRLSTISGKGPFYAFNVLSTGVDAFITHNTNKMKGKLPGDSYKLWVDIAALFYDRIYTVGKMQVKAFDGEGNSVKSFEEKVLLLAMGVSGKRTYGSHKWILPDDRNVCALKQMSVFRKLTLKENFKTGTHIDKPEAILFNAHKVEIKGFHPILAQMDGETVLLTATDFPATIELTEPAIPLLRNRNQH